MQKNINKAINILIKKNQKLIALKNDMKKNVFFKLLLLILLLLFTGIVIFFNLSATDTTTATDFYNNPKAFENASAKDLENCVILDKDIVVLVINRKQEYIAYSEMLKAIAEQKDRFNIEGLNIVIKANADHHKVAYILGLFSKADIKKYRLLKD